MLFSVSMLFGCAHYEVNYGHGAIPGYFVRSEMQDADRAVESARQAGKDNAYDAFRACHTEEGVALAKKATTMADALCPQQLAAVPIAAAPVAIPTAIPTPAPYKYCITLHIEFDIDRTIIRPQYHDEVAKVGDFMKKYPTTTAVIEWHTDNV